MIVILLHSYATLHWCQKPVVLADHLRNEETKLQKRLRQNKHLEKKLHRRGKLTFTNLKINIIAP